VHLVGFTIETCGHIIKTAAAEVHITVLGKPQHAGRLAAKDTEMF